MKKIACVMSLVLFISGCASVSEKADTHSLKVLPVSMVNWEKLNPARGNKSPQAATLWGNRKANVATGFLVKFVDGFSSPPHIHNVSYRGIVIDGLVHNDDPKAAKMWMPRGAFWTQPKGEAHITSAKGKTNIAYIEIESGPYLVRPVKKAFDSGERPVNVDPSNLVWIDKGGAQLAYLWGTPKKDQMNGTMVKVPARRSLKIAGGNSTMQVVVIKGTPKLMGERKVGAQQLEPGSYVTAGTTGLEFKSSSKDTIIYVRTKGQYSIN